MNNIEFIKNVENMVNPIDVGTVHFIESYTNIIPKSMQYNIMKSGSTKNPYMGFVVEPYSSFLCYKIHNIDMAKNLLSDEYELVKCAILEGGEEHYFFIIGSFNVHASAFWGTRLECYIMAKDKRTGLVSWVIVDYITNTVSFDKKNGLFANNSSKCVHTSTYDGKVLIDIQGKESSQKVTATIDITNPTSYKMDKSVWLEGNLSVGYGSKYSKNSSKSFSTIFIPEEVDYAYEIERSKYNVNIEWFEDLHENEPTHVIVYPYTQHFLSNSPGFYSQLNSEDDLLDLISTLNKDSLNKYSTNKIKLGFKFGQVISILLITVLIILLITK